MPSQKGPTLVRGTCFNACPLALTNEPSSTMSLLGSISGGGTARAGVGRSSLPDLRRPFPTPFTALVLTTASSSWERTNWKVGCNWFAWAFKLRHGWALVRALCSFWRSKACKIKCTRESMASPGTPWSLNRVRSRSSAFMSRPAPHLQGRGTWKQNLTKSQKSLRAWLWRALASARLATKGTSSTTNLKKLRAQGPQSPEASKVGLVLVHVKVREPETFARLWWMTFKRLSGEPGTSQVRIDIPLVCGDQMQGTQCPSKWTALTMCFGWNPNARYHAEINPPDPESATWVASSTSRTAHSPWGHESVSWESCRISSSSAQRNCWWSRTARRSRLRILAWRSAIKLAASWIEGQSSWKSSVEDNATKGSARVPASAGTDSSEIRTRFKAGSSGASRGPQKGTSTGMTGW